MIRLGIDLGGTKTEIIALDDRRTEILRRRETTPADDYAATIDLIARMIRETEVEIGKKGSIGIGTPGTLSPVTQLMRNSNSICLNGRALAHDLERALGRQIRIANDANCFALSEALDGAARGAEIVFGVILGTGVGGGLVVSGQILRGANSIAGEWGHNALPWPQPDELPGPRCYCGRNGCIETFLSGPGLSRDHERATRRRQTAREIGEGSVLGDSEAEESLGRYAHRLARGLASVINVLDPDVIVLGGGVSNIEHLYQHVPRLWKEWIFSDVVRTRLVPNFHGDSGGVRGAALLWEYDG